MTQMGDSQTNLMEFASGTLPKDRHSSSAVEISWKEDEEDGALTVSALQRTDSQRLSYTLEWSSDLNIWVPATGILS